VGGRSEAAKPAAPAPAPAAAPAAPAAPGALTPYQAWQARVQALSKERPPSSEQEARKAWSQRFEALMKERPQPDSPPAPPPSSKDKHRRD